MENFKTYLDDIVDPNQKDIMTRVLTWVKTTFPELETRIAWNQPMFTHHGTFILGFSMAKKHFAIAPEVNTILIFKDELLEKKIDHTQMLFKFKWTDAIDYDLIERMVRHNLEDKKDCKTFWR